MRLPISNLDTLPTSILIENLLNPNSYPHPVSVITTIETHISIVFLTGEFAYKLKKPVNFGFLDFSTLAKRKQFTGLEITLNKRTAPSVYLNVQPVYRLKNNRLTLLPQTTEPVEYLVKMKQFNPNLVLGNVLKTHSLTEQQTAQLSLAISTLHRDAQRVAPTMPFGDPDDLIQPMMDNFATCLTLFPHPDMQYRLTQLAQWTRQTHQKLKTTLLLRKQNGFVKECHGDLHLDNITLIDQKPTLFDGIEFSEQFRWIDVQNDLAFMLIDLEFKQQHRLYNTLLNQYCQHTGDFDGLRVLSFYQVYRFMVRVKITALRCQQYPQNELTKIASCTEIAKTHLNLAENQAYLPKHPKLIIMQGVSGSGKSFYSQQLVSALGMIKISSDTERKRLFGIPPLARVTDTQKQALYSTTLNKQTYQHLLEKTESLLSAGFSVIVDATFLKESYRQPFLDLATKQQTPCYQFCIKPNKAIASQQIEKRHQLNNNHSDATIDIMKQQCKANQPPVNQPSQPVWFQVVGAELNTETFKAWIETAEHPNTGK